MGITQPGNLTATAPTRTDQDDQNELNQELISDIELLRREGFGRRDEYWDRLIVNNANTPKTIIQTHKYTLVQFVPTNAVLSSLVPASGLTPNDLFAFFDKGNLATTYALTVNSNGWKINGTVQNYVIKDNRGWVVLEFIDEDYGFSIARHSIVQNTVPALVSTNFTKVQTMKSVTFYVSDGTTPNGNLTGVTGDICYNGPSGQSFYCSSSGTTWTGM